MAKNKIKHLAAFRDLGGIPTADGRRIRCGMLFRSGHHGKMSRAEAEIMTNLFGVTDIIDLRSPSELLHKPDVISGSVTSRHLPSLTDEENPAISRKNGNSELRRLMAKEGGVFRHLCDTYRTLAVSPLAIESHREVLRTLLESRGGVIWHCTQGKDRTGVATAVILSALGVERDVIRRDYLLYNAGAKIKNFFIYLAMTLLFPGTRRAKSLNYLLSANEAFIDAFFDQVDKSFGSMESYLKNALSFSDEMHDRLCLKYLV